MWIRRKKFLELEKRVADLEEKVQRVLPDSKVVAQRFQRAFSEQVSVSDMDYLRNKADKTYHDKYVTEPVPPSALCDIDAEHMKS